MYYNILSIYLILRNGRRWRRVDAYILIIITLPYHYITYILYNNTPIIQFSPPTIPIH